MPPKPPRSKAPRAPASKAGAALLRATPVADLTETQATADHAMLAEEIAVHDAAY